MPNGPPILVVDDDILVRDTLAMLLRWEGYPVTRAANGQEALDQLRNGTLRRLILLDLMMPVIDSWQFRRHQQADPWLAAIPVVVVSAVTDVRDLGAVGYLCKPVDADELLAAVRQHG